MTERAPIPAPSKQSTSDLTGSSQRVKRLREATENPRSQLSNDEIVGRRP